MYLSESPLFYHTCRQKCICRPHRAICTDGDYYELVKQVRTENPDVDELYIPFMVADILKESYEEVE